jgi:hypothetical protein
MAWQRLSVPIAGEPEPIVVQTVAVDWRLVAFTPDAPLDGLWQAVHRALVRTGAPVPKDYPGFLDVLDGMPEVVDDDDDGIAPLDPTDAAP